MPIKRVAGKAQRKLMRSPLRRCSRKAPGTRMGTWQDWREGSGRSEKLSDRYGHAIRDGR